MEGWFGAATGGLVVGGDHEEHEHIREYPRAVDQILLRPIAVAPCAAISTTCFIARLSASSEWSARGTVVSILTVQTKVQ